MPWLCCNLRSRERSSDRPMGFQVSWGLCGVVLYRDIIDRLAERPKAAMDGLNYIEY